MAGVETWKGELWQTVFSTAAVPVRLDNVLGD